jgi:hypothetical protein
MVGVLHSWTRQLLYHPHVHYIVTSDGLTDDRRWQSSRSDFANKVWQLERSNYEQHWRVVASPFINT